MIMMMMMGGTAKSPWPDVETGNMICAVGLHSLLPRTHQPQISQTMAMIMMVTKMMMIKKMMMVTKMITKMMMMMMMMTIIMVLIFFFFQS